MPHNMDFPDDWNGKESVSDAGDPSLVPGLGRSTGGGHGNLLQNSCLENPMDIESWQATVHGVAMSHTQLKQCSTH